MTTTERGQDAPRRACPGCGGDGWLTLGWPENVSWDENPFPCSHCGGRGWVDDVQRDRRTSWRRIGPSDGSERQR